MSFRLKITLWYALAVILTLLVIRLVTLQILRHSLYDELDSSLQAELVWIKNILHTYQERHVPDSEICDEIQDRSSLNPRKEFISIRHAAGAYYFRSVNLGDDNLPNADTLTEPVTIEKFRGQPIRLVGLRDTEYAIAIGYSLTDTETAIDHVLSSFLVILPFAVILVFGGGLLLVKWFMRPIDEVNRYLAAAATQRLSGQLPMLDIQKNDEIGQLSRQVNGAVKKMRDSMQWILMYSSLVPHQLRTPITIIRCQLETAMREGVSNEQIRRTIASTYDEILRLNGVVENLLNLGKLEAGTLKLQKQKLPVSAFLEEFREEALPLLRNKRIRLTVEEGPDVAVLADREWIRQVLLNLLDNAVRHTRRGGHVQISYTGRQDAMELRFTDTGQGIPPAEIPRLFEPFFQGETSTGESRGAGLGLVMVKSIISAHGGTVRVESVVGEGTTFIITLPLDNAPTRMNSKMLSPQEPAEDRAPDAV